MDNQSSYFRFSTWQTMLSNTTMLVDSRKYPKGFVLVIAASPTDDLCKVVEEGNRCINTLNETAYSTEVAQNITITISGNSDEKDYMIGTLVISGIYLVIFVVSSAISAHMFTYDYHKFEDLAEMIREKLMFKQKQETQRIKSIIGAREKGRKWLESILKQDSLDIPNGKAVVELETYEMLEPELFVDVDELDSFGIDIDAKYS